MKLIKKIENIVNDHSHGSSRLLDDLTMLLLSEKYDQQTLVQAFTKLKNIDPAMIIVHHFISALEPYLNNSFHQHVLRYQKTWQNQSFRIAKQLVNHLPYKKLMVLTHSHSGMVIKVFKLLGDYGYTLEILQTKSEPGGEGRIQANELRKAGITVSIIDDNEIKLIIGKCNCCFLGVDQYDSRQFVNKLGTKAIVASANEIGVPVFVLGDPRKKVAKAHTNKGSFFETIPYLNNVKLISGT